MDAAQQENVERVEQQVLEIVHGLVAELGGRVTHRPALDDLLDRDLGISSLERVELLLRLERAFDVRLADSVMAEAENPKALVAAILRGSSASTEELETLRVAEPPPEGRAAPGSTRSLLDALRWHAERTPDRTHVYLRRDDGTERAITYGALLGRSEAVGAGLTAVGIAPREPVIIMLRTEEAFFPAFLGVLMAGGVPVPVYPPVRTDQLSEYAHRQRTIVESAGARVLITFEEVERLATLVRGQVPSIEAITTVDRLAAGHTAGPPRSLASDDPALIQYTSGSTGNPKGVLLSHANLLANIRAVGEAIEVSPTDVGVSWLPLYHDMGLIGAWLAPLYFGVPVVLMSPMAFLARPSRWLWTIHARRGTVSPAPNFAFDLSVRKIADDEIRGLDLSSWRLALNGSEMVSPETIERFTYRFGPYGFRPESMCPVYGLAESSVGLTTPPLGRRPRIDRIARAPFERARDLVPAPAGEPHPLQFVSCGRPIPGHDVRIVDESGEAVSERREGRIEFRGPSVTRGYYRNPDATNAVMRDGWMASGDLGYWADGELFVTGREKDLIILGGRNVTAQEVEDGVASVPGIRQGCVAAFGVHDARIGTERLVVVAETRELDPTRRESLRRAVVDRVFADLGIPPDTVVITGPGSVLKTSSGKIRRGATRDAYLRGALGQKDSVTRQWIGLIGAALTVRAGSVLDYLGKVAFTLWILVVLLLTLPVLWLCLLVIPSGPRADRAAKRWSRAVLLLSTVRVRVTGREHLRGVGAGLLVANHASYIDPILLMATIPQPFHFIAKRQLADYPLIGTVIRKARHPTIDRTDLLQRLEGAENVVASLKQGNLLVVFPEGTFARPAGLLPFRLGAFRAAVETGSPIVPVAIRGARHMLPDGSRWFRRGPIDVTIGEPLRPVEQGWPEMVRLRDRTRDFIARGSGEPPA
jgi:1-acyl-sn-glycerol-3-phosphate acyltransferase